MFNAAAARALALQASVVKVPAAAEAPPITAPSIEPPLMSAVSATRLSIFAIPSMNRSLNSEPTAPKSTPASFRGNKAPFAILPLNMISSPDALPRVTLPLNSAFSSTAKVPRTRV